MLSTQVLIAAVLAAAPVDAADAAASRPARMALMPAKPMPQSVGQPPPTPGRRIDPAVAPTGGAHVGECGHCRRSACPQCRLSGAGAAVMHGPCQHGLCPAHCPVRPDVFGFYGTQWRKWPGSGVVQTSGQNEATPAAPPKAEVPQATEESLQPPGGEEPTQATKPDRGSAAESGLDDAAEGRGDSGRQPLPRPFPEAEDGATVMPRPGRRSQRVIFLDSSLGARFVTDADGGGAGDGRPRTGGVAGVGRQAASTEDSTAVVAAEAAMAFDGDDDPVVPRGTIPWRSFLAADDEANARP